ncbi:hypothetical protein [Treponema pedis]|uniref:hypothetical protein n=1 Tax=Treponema pedis TaxID=409322 RepID=UPI000428EA0E|nr:hypothetical protein [Treponema pedis]
MQIFKIYLIELKQIDSAFVYKKYNNLKIFQTIDIFILPPPPHCQALLTRFSANF